MSNLLKLPVFLSQTRMVFHAENKDDHELSSFVSFSQEALPCNNYSQIMLFSIFFVSFLIVYGLGTRQLFRTAEADVLCVYIVKDLCEV